jgi:hypothetical protein
VSSPAETAQTVTASIGREAAISGNEAAMYRLVLACNPSTHEGEMQLAWAPNAELGPISASIDGRAAVTYDYAGHTGGTAILGPASIGFPAGTPLPVKSMRVTRLATGQAVEFPAADLPQAARQSLGACFPDAASR